MESRGEVEEKNGKKNGEKGWRGSEILRKNLARTLSRTMEYAVYLGNSFSSLLSAFPIFFFLLLSRTSISERLKSVCTFESRDSRSFFFLFETRERRVGVKIPWGRKEGGFFFSYRRG